MSTSQIRRNRQIIEEYENKLGFERQENAILRVDNAKLRKWEAAGRAMLAASNTCEYQDLFSAAWRQLRDCEKENA